MRKDRISLGKLAYASHIYDAMTGFGNSYRVFQDSMQGEPKLSDQHIGDALPSTCCACENSGGAASAEPRGGN